MLTLRVNLKQEVHSQPISHDISLPADMPGFLRDQLQSAPVKITPPAAATASSSFNIIFNDDTVQITHNGQISNIALDMPLNLILENTAIDIAMVENKDNIEPVKQPEKITYTLPTPAPAHVLATDYFIAPVAVREDAYIPMLAPMEKYEHKDPASGDILRDLGFTDTQRKW